MRAKLHANELSISDALAHDLLSAHAPRFAELPLTRLDNTGSTNVLFRMGDEYLLRLPRQPGGGECIAKEHRWLPIIGPSIPCAVPDVLRLVEASNKFPERWSILRWIEGTAPNSHGSAKEDTPGERQLARDLSAVILSLRRIPVPPSATVDPTLQSYRGEPLANVHNQMMRNIAYCKNHTGLDLDLDLSLVTRVWEYSMHKAQSHQRRETAWFHADLVAENLLVNGDGLTGVLDFGSLGVGDPTVDLHGAWEVLGPDSRAYFRELMDVSDDEWTAGRTWALAIAIGAIAYYWDSMPARARQRIDMAQAVLSDAQETGFLT